MAETFWDLFAGYTVVWIFVCVFLIRLMRSQTKQVKLLEEMEEKLKR